MRRAWWWIVVLLLGIMAVMMAGHRGQDSSGGSYATFTSQPLKVRFDYPAGWLVREMAKPIGKVAGEVQIFGPRRDDLKYSLYVDVTAEARPGPGTPAPTLDAAVQAWLAQQRHLPSYQLLEQHAVRCAGQPAMRLLVGYSLPLPLEAAQRKKVAFHELTAFCLRDGQLFRLTYAAPVEDFARHRHAFERLVKSFRFLR